MKNMPRILYVFLLVLFVLASCNLPSRQSAQNASLTAAAQTVEALLSATPFGGAPATATFTPNVPPTETFTPQPLNTNTPAATATSNCNVAQFITDVTIPDGTIMVPGQAFVKKWRIRNVGSCTWTGFSMVFDSGDSMGGPASKPIATVNPNQEVDLEVNLTAPNTAGTYRGYWRIVTNGNVLVPMVNGHQGKSFYVDIKVATATNTSAPPFAVTSVTYNVSGTCGNFQISANITVNRAGTVEYFWQANGYDDFEGTYGSTLVFASAGTQTTPAINWSITANGSHYLRLYVDDPNNQFFGPTSNMVCP